MKLTSQEIAQLYDVRLELQRVVDRLRRKKTAEAIECAERGIARADHLILLASGKHPS